MTVSRRTLIKGGTLALAVTAAGAVVFDTPDVAAVIFDSRSAASLVFAARFNGQRVDIAFEDAKYWQSLRSMSKQGAIVGMTRWNDFVIARGFLQERGMRISHERLEDGFCRWTMA